MFNSTVFNKTRNIDRGLPTSYYIKKNESTPEDTSDLDNMIYEDRRSVIKNYGPDPLLFDYEQPRENVGSVEKLNLRHYGSLRPELPYGNGDYNIQFRDRDPRGCVEDNHNWKKFREDGEPRSKLQLFGKDSDNSIPEQGIAPVDMVGRISELRRALRGRIQWFSESLDNFITRNYNTDNYFTDVDKHIIEDTSSTVDPTILDSVGRMNINRIMSNNLHTGGKYFISRTTPDQVLPVASYGFVFKSGKPITIAETTSMMEGSQKLNSLKVTNKNKLLKIILDGKKQETIGETSRFNKLLSLQDKNKDNIVVKDIMAILGITENELKYIKSMESTNRKIYEECMANLLDMVVVLEKLPPNVLLDIRGELLAARTPDFHGGLCKTTKYSQKIKDILENKNTKQNTETFTGKNNTISTGKRNLINIHTTNKKKTFFQPKQGEVKLEKVNYLNEINKNKKIKENGNPNSFLGKNEHFVQESVNTLKNLSNIFNFKKLNTEEDIDFGREHQMGHHLKPVNMDRYNSKLDFI